MTLLEILGWGSLILLIGTGVGWLVLAGLNNSRGDAE